MAVAKLNFNKNMQSGTLMTVWISFEANSDDKYIGLQTFDYFRLN